MQKIYYHVPISSIFSPYHHHQDYNIKLNYRRWVHQDHFFLSLVFLKNTDPNTKNKNKTKQSKSMVSSSCLPSFLHYPLTLLYLFLLPIVSPSITIPLLQPQTNTNQYQNQYQNLNNLVSTSLTRALHLKNPPTTTTTTPIFSHSYGGYSISLGFGTPPQTLSFIMDTGSDFVWFPCTSHYLCKNCSFPSSTSKIQSFIPKHSSSSKIIGCKNPKCSWIHPNNLQCQEDCNSSRNCSQICPPYLILYGSGTTGGVALSETLRLQHHLAIPNFLVGCSVSSSRQPAGIAGFGRGPTSLPAQLRLSKFSYCLLSRKFDDDTTKFSSLLLDSDHSVSDKKSPALAYTNFISPKSGPRRPFSVYYYLGLRKITVGGRGIKIPYKYLSPGADGNGGTVIDSGSTFTFMSSAAFEPLSDALVAQMKEEKGYRRDFAVERLTGLRPCFNVSGAKTVSFPELKLHFKGGAEMGLPAENYFGLVSDGVACLTVVTDGLAGPERDGGPGIILGDFQMQNFHVEYDLRNERLGFRQEKCK